MKDLFEKLFGNEDFGKGMKKVPVCLLKDQTEVYFLTKQLEDLSEKAVLDCKSIKDRAMKDLEAVTVEMKERTKILWREISAKLEAAGVVGSVEDDLHFDEGVMYKMVPEKKEGK